MHPPPPPRLPADALAITHESTHESTRESTHGSTRNLARVAALVAVLLAGCAGGPPRGGAPVPAAPASSAATPPATPPPPPLAGELRWMRGWFDGTPVRVDGERDGAMRIAMPAVHAFEPAGTLPKPPLRALLDRVAQSLLRQPAARLQAALPEPQARERALALRNYLRDKGIGAWRLALLPPAGDELLLRVLPGAPAIERLDDRSLPSAAGSFPPPAAGPAQAARKPSNAAPNAAPNRGSALERGR